MLRFISNYLLMQVPELRPWIFPVDPFNRAGSARQNLKGMKDAIKHLRGGGCISTFPSGTVSHLQLRQGAVTDPPWNTHVARLARAAEATVLPIYVEGQNSALFQLAGLVHPLLRTALLPREMMQQRAHLLRMRIGQPIPFKRLDDFPTDGAMTEFLRLNTYMLRDRAGAVPRSRVFLPRFRSRPLQSAAGNWRPLAPAGAHRQPNWQVISPRCPRVRFWLNTGRSPWLMPTLSKSH